MASQASNTNPPADPYKATNIDNVPLKDKIEGLSSFIKKCKFGMMTTRDEKKGILVSRCMALTATENNGIDLLFHTNTESGKTHELAGDPHINVAFLNSSGEWASISGTATVVTDRDLVRKHYVSTLRAWLGDLGDGKHDGSENDPRLGIIRVKMSTATYSLVASNLLSRATEVARGAVTGKPAEVNKLREINEAEVTQWRNSAVIV